MPKDAVRVDGAGRFLIPALIDAHVHLTTRPEAEAPAAVLLPSLVAHGVLAVRDMGGDLDRLVAMRAAIAAGTLAGPAIITPGPFIDGPQDAIADGVSGRDPRRGRRRRRRALAARRVDFIKVQAGLTPELWRAAIEAARAARLPVAGHVPEAMSAFDVVAGRAAQRRARVAGAAGRRRVDVVGVARRGRAARRDEGDRGGLGAARARSRRASARATARCSGG